MPKISFFVRAKYDEEAKVFFSESNIDGLHIETETIDEFEAVLRELAPELIITNHISRSDLTKVSFADMIPTILYQAPDNLAVA